jgi:hypothetical protein
MFMMKIRVLLIEDHFLARMALQSGFASQATIYALQRGLLHFD